MKNKGRVISIAILSLLFFTFFFSFLAYGGNAYKTSHGTKDTEAKPWCMIDCIGVDGNKNVYVFYSRTMEINVYSKDGKFLKSHYLAADSENLCRGGLTEKNGEMYAYSNGKTTYRITSYGIWKEEVTVNENYGRTTVTASNGETYTNLYYKAVRGNETVALRSPLVLLFSPLSMALAILFGILTGINTLSYYKKLKRGSK